jgi:hypothetical protein
MISNRYSSFSLIRSNSVSNNSLIDSPRLSIDTQMISYRYSSFSLIRSNSFSNNSLIDSLIFSIVYQMTSDRSPDSSLLIDHLITLLLIFLNFYFFLNEFYIFFNLLYFSRSFSSIWNQMIQKTFV